MELSEFEKGFMLLRGAYGDRVFPKEREQVLWKRYRAAEHGKFQAAVDAIVLRMPGAPAILEWLDEKLGTEAPKGPYASPWACDRCRDDGWIAPGYELATATGTVEACSCHTGRHLGPHELHKIQQDFDKGGEIIRRARVGKNLGSLAGFPPLPYDPKRREGA